MRRLVDPSPLHDRNAQAESVHIPGCVLLWARVLVPAMCGACPSTMPCTFGLAPLLSMLWLAHRISTYCYVACTWLDAESRG